MIPLFGGLLSSLGGLALFIISAIVSIVTTGLTIGLAWVSYRPLILLAVAILSTGITMICLYA